MNNKSYYGKRLPYYNDFENNYVNYQNQDIYDYNYDYEYKNDFDNYNDFSNYDEEYNDFKFIKQQKNQNKNNPFNKNKYVSGKKYHNNNSHMNNVNYIQENFVHKSNVKNEKKTYKMKTSNKSIESMLIEPTLLNPQSLNYSTMSSSSQFPSNPSNKKASKLDASFLCNFQYTDASAHIQSAGAPSGRVQKAQNRNENTGTGKKKGKKTSKQCFLFTSYQFIVSDDMRIEHEGYWNPNVMIPWDEVHHVLAWKKEDESYDEEKEILCPICLEKPVVPMITSCGHIFW